MLFLQASLAVWDDFFGAQILDLIAEVALRVRAAPHARERIARGSALTCV